MKKSFKRTLSPANISHILFCPSNRLFLHVEMEPRVGKKIRTVVFHEGSAGISTHPERERERKSAACSVNDIDVRSGAETGGVFALVFPLPLH